MRRALASIALIACGPPPVFHKDAERGCADVTLAGPEDVAATAGCRAVDSLTLRTGMPLDLKSLGRLETIRGALVVGPSVGFSELALPKLRRVESIRIVANGDLTGVFLPLLEHAGAFEIEGNQALSTVSAPALMATRKLVVTANASLVVLNLAALASATVVTVDNNPKLSIIDSKLPNLAPPPPAVESVPQPP